MTEAEQILYDLFSVRDLGDFVYNIRENECKGWDGPKVILWGNACDRAHKLLKKLEEDKPKITFIIKDQEPKDGSFSKFERLHGHSFEFVAKTDLRDLDI